jgi:hypothetical protein
MARALGWFWGIVTVVLICGAVTLQLLGPPPARVIAANPVVAPRPSAAPAQPAPPTVTRPPSAPATPATAPPSVSPLSVPQLARPDLAKPDPTRADATRTDATRVGAIAPPDPALMEVSAIYPDRSLPKIGADGRMPMTVYAGAVDPADTRPRIAILLSDIGMSDPESKDAIATLPAAMSLAFSPYADLPASLLLAARARGHESLVAVPMEPQNAPLNDAGPQALLTGVPTLENIRRLEWVLTRMTGYVGATGGLGRLQASASPLPATR